MEAAWRRALRWTMAYVTFLLATRAAAVALAHGENGRRELTGMASTLVMSAVVCLLLARRTRWALGGMTWIATVGAGAVALGTTAMALTGMLGPWGIARGLASALAAGAWGVALHRTRRVVAG